MKNFLQPSKTAQNKEYGLFHYCSDDYESVVQWKNNKVVYIAIIFDKIEPYKAVKRYCLRKKMEIESVQPFCFLSVELFSRAV